MTTPFSIREWFHRGGRRSVVAGAAVVWLTAAVGAAFAQDSPQRIQAARPQFDCTRTADLNMERPAGDSRSESETHTAHNESKAGKGFYLGIQFNGSSLHLDDEDIDNFFVKDDGGGFQLRAGYRFNYVFSLEIDAGGANHDTSDQRVSADVGFVQLFAVYRFARNSSFRPYLKGGIGGYGLSLSENDVSVGVGGGGIAFGGGFEYYFSRHFALGVDFVHNMINYNQLELKIGGATVGTEIDEEGAMSTLGLSFGYFF